jgi:hypothetical protein
MVQWRQYLPGAASGGSSAEQQQRFVNSSRSMEKDGGHRRPFYFWHDKRMQLRREAKAGENVPRRVRRLFCWQ